MVLLIGQKNEQGKHLFQVRSLFLVERAYLKTKKSGQRIFPVGGGDVKSIVLSLQNETRPVTQSHIARCVDRQLRYRSI